MLVVGAWGHQAGLLCDRRLVPGGRLRYSSSVQLVLGSVFDAPPCRRAGESSDTHGARLFLAISSSTAPSARSRCSTRMSSNSMERALHGLLFAWCSVASCCMNEPPRGRPGTALSGAVQHPDGCRHERVGLPGLASTRKARQSMSLFATFDVALRVRDRCRDAAHSFQVSGSSGA